MPPIGRQQAAQEATAAVKMIQDLDLQRIPPKSTLGESFHLEDVREPLGLLVKLYNNVPSFVLSDLPTERLNFIKSMAKTLQRTFEAIITYTPDVVNALEQRKKLIKEIEEEYTTAYKNLAPLLAIALYRSLDLPALATERLSEITKAGDTAEQGVAEIHSSLEKVETLMEVFRTRAEEMGIMQQAVHFSEAAADHARAAKTSYRFMLLMALLLGLYAILSLYIHKVEWLAPKNLYDSIQLAVSKVLIFAVIAYMLYISVRDYLSNRHNTVVNAHRQNALLTYQALVEATEEPKDRAVVLTKAAECIFSPQSTGYTRETTTQIAGPSSVVELLTKPLSGGD